MAMTEELIFRRKIVPTFALTGRSTIPETGPFVYSSYIEASMTEASRVYSEMKQDVATCVLAPGSSVSEAELCRRYQTSRTPVRESCRRLCDEGMIQIIPFRGYIITPLTIEEYRNLYEVQSILDPMVAGLAAERATPDQIKEMEYWASYEYHPGQKNSYYTFLEWNKHFHIAIAEATGNRAFVDIVTNMQARLVRYFYLVIIMDSYGQQLVAEHHEIVRAIRAGDAQAAREHAMEHVTKTVGRSSNVDVRSVSIQPGVSTGANMEWLFESTPVRTKTRRPRKQLTRK
jgi:DNA-binding GntR family transcriptional regulator